jgi:hypothetical protein
MISSQQQCSIHCFKTIGLVPAHPAMRYEMAEPTRGFGFSFHPVVDLGLPTRRHRPQFVGGPHASAITVGLDANTHGSLQHQPAGDHSSHTLLLRLLFLLFGPQTKPTTDMMDNGSTRSVSRLVATRIDIIIGQGQPFP